MKVPIPQDWNGEDWQCIRVQWPDSVEWTGLLIGVLTILTRGRYWDEKTGLIKGVQDTAWEIFDKSYPFVSCTGDEVEKPPPETVVNYVGGCLGTGDEEMPCIDLTNMIELRNNGTELWVRNGCCEWTLIGAITSTKEGVPTDSPIDDPEDETQQFYSCGKVAGLVDSLADMINAALATYTSPLSFMGAVRSSVPSVQLTTSALYLLLFDFVTVTKLVSNEDIINDDMIAKFKCAAVLGVSDTSEATDGEQAYVMSSIKAVIYNTTSPASTSDLIWTLWEQCWQAIGPGDSRQLMQLNAEDGVSDCSCPEEFPPYNGVVTWEDARQINVESQGASLLSATKIAPNVMEFVVQGGQNQNYQEVHWDEFLQASGMIQELEIHYELISAAVAGYFPSEQWDDPNPTPVANYMKPECFAANVNNFYPVPNKQTYIGTFTAPTNVDTSRIDFDIKINPKNQQAIRQVWTFRATIVYSGDLR